MSIEGRIPQPGFSCSEHILNIHCYVPCQPDYRGVPDESKETWTHVGLARLGRSRLGSPTFLGEIGLWPNNE